MAGAQDAKGAVSIAQTQTQILLACYNGRSYLDAQIRSVLAQSEPDWQLLMRDDGSFDGTNAILRAWTQKDARRLCLLADHKATGGAMANFRLLAAASTAPYVMFCDQDDIWHPDKLQKTQRKCAPWSGSLARIRRFWCIATCAW